MSRFSVESSQSKGIKGIIKCYIVLDIDYYSKYSLVFVLHEIKRTYLVSIIIKPLSLYIASQCGRGFPDTCLLKTRKSFIEFIFCCRLSKDLRD